MYLGINAIGDHDLGFAMAQKAMATSTLEKSKTQQSQNLFHNALIPSTVTPHNDTQQQDERVSRRDASRPPDLFIFLVIFLYQ
jgi:hypothetical protein